MGIPGASQGISSASLGIPMGHRGNLMSFAWVTKQTSHERPMRHHEQFMGTSWLSKRTPRGILWSARGQPRDIVGTLLASEKYRMCVSLASHIATLWTPRGELEESCGGYPMGVPWMISYASHGNDIGILWDIVGTPWASRVVSREPRWNTML